MASPTWADAARDRRCGQPDHPPALTGREEDWRFTPPADLGLEGPEPDAPGAATVPGHVRRRAGRPPGAGRRRARRARARRACPTA